MHVLLITTDLWVRQLRAHEDALGGKVVMSDIVKNAIKSIKNINPVVELTLQQYTRLTLKYPKSEQLRNRNQLSQNTFIIYTCTQDFTKYTRSQL